MNSSDPQTTTTTSTVTATGSKNDEPVATALNGPLVFSCGNCRTIIGDSLSLIGTHAQLRTITLSAASKITRTEDLLTSKTGVDKGSTFVNLTCFSCSSLVGKYYLTTPKGLDDLRERFSFTIDNITSYELGKSEYGQIEMNPEPPVVISSNNGIGEDEDENILKIQHVILGLESRINKLEEEHHASSHHYESQPVSTRKSPHNNHNYNQSLSVENNNNNNNNNKKNSTNNTNSDYWSNENDSTEPNKKKSRK
jgi:hypothetical protein